MNRVKRQFWKFLWGHVQTVPWYMTLAMSSFQKFLRDHVWIVPGNTESNLKSVALNVLVIIRECIVAHQHEPFA